MVKRNGRICCLYETDAELQQVKKERLSGTNELQMPSHYTPDNCVPTHCYSIYEVFAPAVLFPLVPSDIKSFSLLLKGNYFSPCNYLYIKINLATDVLCQTFLMKKIEIWIALGKKPLQNVNNNLKITMIF